MSEKAKQDRAKRMVRPDADSAEPEDIAATGVSVDKALPCVEPEEFIFDTLGEITPPGSRICSMAASSGASSPSGGMWAGSKAALRESSKNKRRNPTRLFRVLISR